MTISEISDQLRVLTKLEECSIVFFLTGSRYFGTESEESDYDYYTEDSNDTSLWLKANGFEYLSEAYPEDLQITSVYRHHSAHIDVQLVENIELKHKAQMALQITGLLRYTNKVHHRIVWKALYLAMGAGKSNA